MTDLFTGAEKIVIGKNKIQYWIDIIETDEYSFRIIGWVYVLGIPNWQIETKIDFKGSDYSFSCKPTIVHREDVSHDHGRGKVNYNESGFFIEVPRQNIGPDKYNISFTLKKKKSNDLLISYSFLCMEVK